MNRKYIKVSFGNENGLAYRVYTDVNGKIEVYSADFSQKVAIAATFEEAVSRLISENFMPWKMDINDSTVFEGQTLAEFAAELAKIGVTIDVRTIDEPPRKAKTAVKPYRRFAYPAKWQERRLTTSKPR